jgi:23S rRNA pseudouridine1911/1915/1917 synthase
VDEKQQYRLDVRLTEDHPELTRSQIKRLIEDGHVTVNGKIVSKAGTTIKAGSDIAVSLHILGQTIKEIELPILYEDDNCVVIDKPLGVLTHSKGTFNSEGTVATWLSSRSDFSFSDPHERSGIVHRLDRATSGVMICAKNAETLGFLQKQFQIRKVKKLYIARVSGHLRLQHARLDLPIERNPKKPQTFRVGANGKSAVTEYKVTQEFNDSSLVELRPTTGRTHQLRVHMHHLGHPIIGDILYAGKPASRLYLHAHSLEITVPGGKRMTFSANVPTEFLNEVIS